MIRYTEKTTETRRELYEDGSTHSSISVTTHELRGPKALVQIFRRIRQGFRA